MTESPLEADVYTRTGCHLCDDAKRLLQSHGFAVNEVDIDESPDVAQKYAVTGVPTLVVFKGGEEADRKVGALPKPALESWVQQYGG